MGLFSLIVLSVIFWLLRLPLLQPQYHLLSFFWILDGLAPGLSRQSNYWVIGSSSTGPEFGCQRMVISIGHNFLLVLLNIVTSWLYAYYRENGQTFIGEILEIR